MAETGRKREKGKRKDKGEQENRRGGVGAIFGGVALARLAPCTVNKKVTTGE